MIKLREKLKATLFRVNLSNFFYTGTFLRLEMNKTKNDIYRVNLVEEICADRKEALPENKFTTRDAI